ncbi:cation-translocating P-type ATPase [Saccharopolyspora sp. 7B]|uniref:cation-translocating P-type ATPase n=1 Tax=Saccharopolyspora sp. 7B TaxID=2877240 RepID=UPI001CD771A3|nr:cation-translocating P-type ATPase [Saccharopolyspora sp. 7B]MCA1280806.1 cation-translocating P-type ATPase [Saccharopolyspora sp. 7B]
MPFGALLSRVAHLAAPVLDAVRNTGSPPLNRRTYSRQGRTHLEVRGLHLPESAGAARDLRARLSEVDGVASVEVNAVLGRVLVHHDAEQVGCAVLAEVVDAVERDHDLAGLGSSPAGVAHPGNPDALMRDVGAFGLSVLGLGYSAVAGLLPFRPASPLIPAAVSLADAVPWLREGAERTLGRTGAEAALAVGGAVTQGLSQNPLAVFSDLSARFCSAREGIARQQAWRRWEETTPPGAHESTAISTEPRPVELPDGPVEQISNLAGAFALGGYGTVLAATRDQRRALATMLAAIPKPAKTGREGFAAQLTTALSARGTLVLEPKALRKLDRVDTVVLDAPALLTGRRVVDEVLPLDSDADATRLFAHAAELVDPQRPKARRSRGKWSCAPLDGRAAQLPGRVQAELRAHRDRGAVLLELRRNDEAVAVVVVIDELDPLAEALAEAARAAGTAVLAGIGSKLNRRITVDDVVHGGTRLAASVRRLQQDGRVVAVLSTRAHAALAAADVGIGIAEDDQPMPWGADLLSPNRSEAHSTLCAVAEARTASKHAAALCAGGACLGVLFGALGPSAGAPARAGLPVHAANLFALGTGTLAGFQAGERPPPAPHQRTPWHALPGRAVLGLLDSSVDGLSAAVARRWRRAQPQRADRGIGVVGATLEGLVNPMTPVLVAGAVVSAGLGSAVDAVLITGVLGISALIDGVQRIATDRELARLLDAGQLPAHVRRDGTTSTVPADQLVPGDVVELRSGDGVPADCRVLAAEYLEVDESSLTGESALVVKTPEATSAAALGDRTGMLYQGTTVATGTATAVVVATGAATEVGRTTGEDGHPTGAAGGVEARLAELTRQILPLSVGAGGALLAVDLLRGTPLRTTVGRAVGLAVAAVPEGLPFVATLAELAAARRLARRGVLVRSPATIEALGRVDALCFDKTGTLTQGRITLGQVSDGTRSSTPDRLDAAGRAVVEAAVRANPQAEGDQPLPHLTDRAVLEGALAAGIDPNDREVLADLPFEPSRSFHATRTRGPDGVELHVKGAPEVVLERCTRWRGAEFDAPARAEVEREIERLALLGYRLLAVAEKAAPDDTGSELDDAEVYGLNFVGLLGLADPVHPTAAEAVSRLRRAGVDVIMITGDHPSTAEAIAAELGMLGGKRVLHGAELDELDDEELAAELPAVSVFARVSPAQKARIVRLLRADGRTVAMTGDGANDVPAIKLAHVGIALGSRATPAARESADLVVADDRIETITDGIVEGRGMWASVHDALSMLLGGNLGEIGYAVGSGFFGGDAGLNARQLLVVNMLTDVLPAIASAVRPPPHATPERLLAEGPDASLGKALTEAVYLRAAATAGAAGLAWALARPVSTAAQARTTGLVALVAAQLAQTLAVRGRTRLVLASGAVSLVVLFGVVQVPGLSRFFGSSPLLPHQWCIAVGSAIGTTTAVVLWQRPPADSSPAEPRALPAAEEEPAEPAPDEITEGADGPVVDGEVLPPPRAARNGADRGIPTGSAPLATTPG